ncbi:MAG: hypothetical protein IJU64_04095, partial [Bacilli bacterium]|nr:hypothetical protein [Bacilli bacterium]
KTMSEALADALEAGYKVENLTPKGNKDIVWNQETDEFAQLEAVPAEDAYKYWTVAKKAADLEKGYSVYLYYGITEINTKVGVDVGSLSGVSVKYTKGETPKLDVRMRTNGGNLEIDADTDNVHHYGVVDKLDIKAVKGQSYHENGKVRVSATVSDGHMVVEPNGFVNELNIPSTATNNVSVKIESKGEVKTAILDKAEAKVSVDTGATLSQIVGETTNVTGGGAAEAKASAVSKTTVNDVDALDTALADPTKKYVVFGEDISSDHPLTIASDVILDGAGHTLTNTATSASDKRGIWVDESNVEATVKNLKIVNGERGIQVNGGKRGVNLKVDNVEIANASMYAVNVCNNAEVNLTITNSKIHGWGAINLWSAKYAVYIADSELYGHNDKGYNADGWNDFGTVILEGDTTEETTSHSSMIDVDIVNTKISATTSGQGNKQWCILFNEQSAFNNVRLTGCELAFNESENTFKVLDQGEGNKLFIDGVEVE